MKKRILWITETAVMLALLVTLQALTKSAGQYVTGSCVNLILAVTALAAGLGSGAAVALLSPFFAFLLGIGPQVLPLVPAISVGNLVYVLLLWGIAGKSLHSLPGSCWPGWARRAAKRWCCICWWCSFCAEYWPFHRSRWTFSRPCSPGRSWPQPWPEAAWPCWQCPLCAKRWGNPEKNLLNITTL